MSCRCVLFVNCLLLRLLLCFVNSAVNYRVVDCPNNSIYDIKSTSGRIYRSNLDFLLSTLTSNGSRPNGFYNFSAGSVDSAVYGLFLCRGDLTPAACQKCVGTASSGILQACPDKNVAVLWDDECMLRYSNRSIFSSYDKQPTRTVSNPYIVTDAVLLDRILGETMDKIAINAAKDNSGKKFAVEEANFTTFQPRMFALGQCTPDLTSLECEMCLRVAIPYLPQCCGNRQGGRVLRPSCNIRFEIYPFYDISNSSQGFEKKKKNSSQGIGGGTIIVIIIFVIILVLVGVRRSRNLYHPLLQAAGIIEIQTRDILQHDFEKIQKATFNFCDANKIGRGGFGPVYKGAFPNGQEIAVKRLSRSSNQGPEEFKTEIELVSKLQHKNLVQLLGFCEEGEDMLLIYEFVPNKSLNNYLFAKNDPEKQALLDWSTRYKIIKGIARGILYLHEDSRLKIIHRDLKASNVLLDRDMNPKISDFGLARLIGDDQYDEQTRKKAGTRSYMAPEYMKHGRLSLKSDIFSFGVLILEIVSGKKRSQFDPKLASGTDDFLTHASRQWRDKTPLALVDENLGDSYAKDEVIQSISVGLECVRPDPEQRPTISSVLLMLNSRTIPVDHSVIPVQQAEEPESQPLRVQEDEGRGKDRNHFFRSMFTYTKRRGDVPT